jgi:peptidoglycan/LPS O-acetylase OafA/YrhL
MKAKLHGLDRLRALAIVMVFVFHYSRLFPHPAWTEALGRFGWTGVDLFFVLSGFLIASQLFKTIAANGKIPLKEFVIKRAFRIIPLYLFVVAVYFLIPAFHEREGLPPLWKFLTFTQNIGLDVRNKGTFSHAWSLCIEEQFYLLFPLILLLLVRLNIFKKGGVIFIVLFAASFLCRLLSWQNLVAPFADADDFASIWYKWIYYPFWCRTDGLVIGVGIAALAQFKPVLMAKMQSKGNWFLALSILILTAAYFVCQDQESFSASVLGFPMVDLGYGFMVLAAVSPTCFLYRYSSKITLSIATLSYGIYLTHKIVIHVVQAQFIGFDKHSNMMFLICTIACFIVAFILNKVIEIPFLRMRKRVLRD